MKRVQKNEGMDIIFFSSLFISQSISESKEAKKSWKARVYERKDTFKVSNQNFRHKLNNLQFDYALNALQNTMKIDTNQKITLSSNSLLKRFTKEQESLMKTGKKITF